MRSGLCLIGACLTRYDGWLLAAGMCVLVVGLAWFGGFRALRPGAKKFVLLATAAPILWLAYNAAVYRNPLEFANGPYAAKAIEQKTAVPGMPAHPGDRDARIAFKYYFKSAGLNMAPAPLQMFWVAGLIFGTAVIVLFQRKLWPVLLFWIPVPLYMLSIAYSGVPIFLPVWWPHSYYNVRYGLQLLPAFAVFVTIAAYLIVGLASRRAVRLTIVLAVLIVVVGSYISIWRDPVCLTEAWINSRTRVALEREVAEYLKALPPGSTLLMYLGDHVGALQQASIPLRRVIYEGNHRTWKHPVDPEGLWERALADPSRYADFVVAFQGDAVSVGVQQSVRKQDLILLAAIHVSGQPEATIYRVRSHNR